MVRTQGWGSGARALSTTEVGSQPGEKFGQRHQVRFPPSRQLTGDFLSSLLASSLQQLMPGCCDLQTVHSAVAGVGHPSDGAEDDELVNLSAGDRGIYLQLFGKRRQIHRFGGHLAIGEDRQRRHRYGAGDDAGSAKLPFEHTEHRQLIQQRDTTLFADCHQTSRARRD